MQYYAHTMVASLVTSAADKADSYYVPACLAHVSDTSLQSNTTIGNWTIASAIAAWWNAPDSPTSVVHALDYCEPVPCNPTCPASIESVRAAPSAGAAVAGMTVEDELDVAGVALERAAWM